MLERSTVIDCPSLSGHTIQAELVKALKLFKKEVQQGKLSGEGHQSILLLKMTL